MKNSKKTPKNQIEKFSNVFVQLGLVLALFVVYISLEHQTAHTATTISEKYIDPDEIIEYPKPMFYEKYVPKPKVVKPKVTQPKKVILNKVKPVEDKEIIKKEDKLELPKKEDTPVIKPKQPKKVEVVTPVVKKEAKPVDIKKVQRIPIFAGCEGLSNTEARVCFEKKMKRLIQRYFDTDLANELGLSSGKKRIITQFVIDKNGYISDVKIRAPHPRLKKETKKIVGKIPKFTPGKQNGKPVKVRYTLPIVFKVE